MSGLNVIRSISERSKRSDQREAEVLFKNYPNIENESFATRITTGLKYLNRFNWSLRHSAKAASVDKITLRK